MTRNPGASVDETVVRLLAKLTSIRRSVADYPEEERRSTFKRALEDELGEVSDDFAGKVVDTVRGRLIDEARARETRIAEFEARNRDLVKQIQDVGADRDRLRDECERLARQVAVPSGAGRPSGPSLDGIREGLLKASHGEKVSAESIGVPPSEARLFRLFVALLDFALKYELGLNQLLGVFQIGPVGDADTHMARTLQEEVRERFRACLENKQGSLAALQESLERNAQFLIDLNKAYQAALFEGNQLMLAKLDPRPILEEHRRSLMGPDYEGAWNKIGRQQADLTNLSRAELWEQFFQTPFRSKLVEHLDRS